MQTTIQNKLHRAAIGFGANLNQPEQAVRDALVDLAKVENIQIVKISSLYSTAPVDNSEPQPDYVNAVALIDTALSPEALLGEMLQIEHAHGRMRGERNAARELDLDLLLYDDLVQSTPALQLPHPRMHLRAFVLVPLTEIWEDCVIPGHGTALHLLQACTDQKIVKIVT